MNDLIIATMWRKKLSVALAILLPLCAAAAVQLYYPRTYEATALLLLADQRLGNQAANEGAEASVQRREQIINSQVYIAESFGVLHRAIQKYGTMRLLESWGQHAEQGATGCMFPGCWASIASPIEEKSSEDSMSDVERKLYLRVRGALKIQVERGTDLMRLSFRHRSPQVAADFLNDIVITFVERNVELYGNSGVASFFEDERARYEQALRNAQKDLDEFARQHKVYSVREQRNLALHNRSTLLAEIAKTTASVAEKELVAKSFARQLLEFKPLSSNASLQRLARSAGGAANGLRGLSSQQFVQEPADPPLLLVRVFQDTVQSLVKTNAEIDGSRALGLQQSDELKKIERELSGLSMIEPEFDRLEREIAEKQRNLDLYSRRATEQRLEADFRERRFFNMRVAQAAVVPLNPVFPLPHLVFPAALLVSLTLVAAIVFFG
ncbi:GumC family protein [Methylorubrum extorquens]|uniref:GumC family protein n=1 Tax=Methylorubrum extorquens TaxID=408 RepID=UPI0011BEBEDF|nr:Wzz/FepE/Etk N-terminal domain-containing protein [Methylorubrum extorquens]